MFKIIFTVACILLITMQVQAGTMIWQDIYNRINYVSLSKLKLPKGENLVIQHPYNFDSQKLTQMLFSLHYNKKRLFRSELKGQPVFFQQSLLENKFIPHIVEAFQKATPKQAVVFSMVQKNPSSILRSDQLNVVRAFVAEDGFHLIFDKLGAKLLGDYKDATRGPRMVDDASGMGVMLDPQEGQKLSYTNPNEVILDMDDNFSEVRK